MCYLLNGYNNLKALIIFIIINNFLLATFMGKKKYHTTQLKTITCSYTKQTTTIEKKTLKHQHQQTKLYITQKSYTNNP